jgi:hypothetical protein
MKRTSLTLAAATLVAASFTTPAVAMDMCEMLEGMARSTMAARQKGAPLSAILKIADQIHVYKDEDIDTGQNARIRKLMRSVTFDAFEKPRYSTERAKTHTINEFANSWYLSCLRVTETD